MRSVIRCLFLLLLSLWFGGGLRAQQGPQRAEQPAAQQGEQLYKMFCGACHMADRFHVGPSLVEVAKLYGNKPKEFVAWCRAPQKKRQGVIQMPSMAHLNEPQLRQIHSWIMTSTKGKDEVQVEGLDGFRASPSMRRRPLVQRIFMPDAGPAAIAVATNDDWHYCWDAGSCRLRYVWKGDFIDGWPVWRGNGDAFAKVRGQVLLREARTPIPVASDVKARFLGYRMKGGLPTMRYRLGDVQVTERITPLAGGDGLQRSFTLRGARDGWKFTLTAAAKMAYTSEHGTFDGLVFTPSSGRERAFTIVMREKK